MRRRLQRFFPVVLIALMVQILAPIGACWAAAFATSDPLKLAEICHSDSAAAAGQTDRGDHHLHDGACSICCTTQASASLDTPQAVIVAAPPRRVARIVWLDAAQDRSPPRIGSNAQARAPPLSM
jgi:hypothetical protein